MGRRAFGARASSSQRNSDATGSGRGGRSDEISRTTRRRTGGVESEAGSSTGARRQDAGGGGTPGQQRFSAVGKKLRGNGDGGARATSFAGNARVLRQSIFPAADFSGGGDGEGRRSEVRCEGFGRAARVARDGLSHAAGGHGSAACCGGRKP